MGFNLFKWFNSRKDLKKFIIGQEIKPLEELYLFLKDILQCFLDCIKRFIVCLKHLKGIAIIVALIGIFFYIDGIFCLFHDSFPFAIDLVEQGCLLR